MGYSSSLAFASSMIGAGGRAREGGGDGGAAELVCSPSCGSQPEGRKGGGDDRMILRSVSLCAAIVRRAMVIRVQAPSFTCRTRLTAALPSMEHSPMLHHFSCAVVCDVVIGWWGWTSGVGSRAR